MCVSAERLLGLYDNVRTNNLCVGGHGWWFALLAFGAKLLRSRDESEAPQVIIG